MSGIQYANFALSTLTLRLTAGRDDRQTFLSLVDVLEHPCCPIPSKPDHEVRKQTLKSCYYVHSVLRQFQPVR